MIDSAGVDPSRPRASGNMRQQHRPNVHAQTTSEYWKRNMYIPFISLKNCIPVLFSAVTRFKAQYLLPIQYHHLTDANVMAKSLNLKVIYQIFSHFNAKFSDAK